MKVVRIDHKEDHKVMIMKDHIEEVKEEIIITTIDHTEEPDNMKKVKDHTEVEDITNKEKDLIEVVDNMKKVVIDHIEEEDNMMKIDLIEEVEVDMKKVVKEEQDLHIIQKIDKD